MDMTRTIRYEGPSHLEARILQGLLEEHGVRVEPAPKGRERRDELVERQQRELAELQAQQEKERRELVERQQQERAEQSGALSEVTQLSQVIVDLEGTGAAVAIAAAVKSFRNIAPAPHGKVEVEGEAQDPGDDSG